MSAAYFEDHPTDPNKVILRKKPYLNKGADYEHGFIDGMQHQMQSSVDRAVNTMSQREWVGLTDEEIQLAWKAVECSDFYDCVVPLSKAIEQALKEKNT